jgi:hypothetical protein
MLYERVFCDTLPAPISVLRCPESRDRATAQQKKYHHLETEQGLNHFIFSELLPPPFQPLRTHSITLRPWHIVNSLSFIHVANSPTRRLCTMLARYRQQIAAISLTSWALSLLERSGLRPSEGKVCFCPETFLEVPIYIEASSAYPIYKASTHR